MRVIPINKTLYNELSGLQRKPEDKYVFPNKHGRPYGEIIKGFVAAIKRAGISDFRFHDLRHTFGSHLVM